MAITYGTLKKDGEFWEIDGMPPFVVVKFKNIFKAIRTYDVQPFRLQHSLELCEDLRWFMARYPFEVPKEDADFLEESAETCIKLREDAESILTGNYTLPTPKLKEPYKLRKYQEQAVNLFNLKGSFLLGDAVGLGKTVQAIGTLLSEENLPGMVVVQASLAKQWEEMIRKFTNLRVHRIKKRTNYPLPPADVYIMRYSIIANWVDVFTQYPMKTLIFDEIQELRRTESEKYRASENIRKVTKKCKGLSATPIYNYGDEIYNIIEIISPGSLGNRGEFLTEWCGPYHSKQVKDPKALGSYLRSRHLFLRRTSEDVGRELPPTNKVIHHVDFDEEAIKKAEKDAKTLAMRVMQGSFVEKGQAARELDVMIRYATGVSKAKYVAQYVRILLENDEPVVLVGWHRDCYDIWNEELREFNPVMYTGSEPPSKKDKAKQAFINGESKLFIMSLRSGVGLDGLQYAKASYIVFGELDWSPAVHTQCIGRLNRDGQSHQVTAIYLVSNSGSDPLMIDKLGVKSSQSQGIVDPFKSAETVSSDDSRVKELAKQLLAKGGKG